MHVANMSARLCVNEHFHLKKIWLPAQQKKKSAQLVIKSSPIAFCAVSKSCSKASPQGYKKKKRIAPEGGQRGIALTLGLNYNPRQK